MQTMLTVKLKLLTTADQFQALRRTQLAYRDALNCVSQYAFAHGKTSNVKRLQGDNYARIRAEFGLPAQLACNVPRQVSGTYKALWTKTRKNAEARRLGYTKKRYRGLDKPPTYVSPTLTYNLGRDYSLRSGQEVSILTLAGRIHVSYRGYDKHVALLRAGATMGAAKLWYDRSKKRFYLLVSLHVKTSDPAPDTYKQVLGIDVGQRYLATVATTNGTQFYSGKQVRAQADHYARLRKRLQRKGTRSATRKLVAISGRERRLKLNTNHVISRRIVDAHPASLIGLEDLNGIRERAKRRKKRRKGSRLVAVSPQARKANRHASKWAFAELQGFLTYKAALASSLCMKVDARYTSQMCPHCGHTSPDNRPRKGLLFACQNPTCHYTLHADLIGARNVCLRTLLVWQDWASTGTLSGHLDVASDEAKAARWQRYAELRWSSVTSPSSSGDLGS